VIERIAMMLRQGHQCLGGVIAIRQNLAVDLRLDLTEISLLRDPNLDRDLPEKNDATSLRWRDLKAIRVTIEA
jgi:hypothetical protein